MPKWSDEKRVKSLISRSAIVTEALEASEGKVGLEAYRQLQTLESKAVAAGAIYDSARSSHNDGLVKRDEAETDLSALNSACLTICKVRGVTATMFEEFDRGDAKGLSIHLQAIVANTGKIGPMMAEMLLNQRSTLEECIDAMTPLTAAVTRTQSELRSVLFKLEGGIANARSLLADKGIAVKYNTKPSTPKKQKTVPAPVEAATPTPVAPTNGSTSHVQPPAKEIVTGGEASFS